jgi:hypothetical protein
MKPKLYFVAQISRGLVVVLSASTEKYEEAKVWYEELSPKHSSLTICETVYG